ncbi:hypothetical protein [Dysgonomonas sp. 25]|uniref:hypothetical protein n=1 Tax=Dysgonomonas sp. 25 TaxID=2302933 RepID=UPI0013D0E6C7|nr:hypothetical protein [Dysgonomonas sp. 25]NDV70091.1 hypothetical protein [Dysgonomonas sp. 25]
MKKVIYLPFFLVFASLLTACSFSAGTKAKPTVGLSYSYNGFRIDDVKVFDTNKNTPLKSKEIAMGKTLFISIENLTGFTVEDGKIYPGGELTVTDPDGNVVLEGSDLYKGEAGYDPGTNVFSLTVRMGAPIVAGKEYITSGRIYDLKNPDNELNITVKSEVVK